MILEGILVFGIIVLILIFFYRQAVQEFRILQTESLDKSISLFGERSPIVVLPAPQPQQLWTRADLSQRPTLGNSAIQGKKLISLINQESVSLKNDKAEHLATLVGLPVWIRETITPIIKQSVWWGPILTPRTEALIGAQGLKQTFGYITCIFVTEGAIQVSLLNESSDPYLPTKWKGKRLSKMTRDDAPLLAQIQYIDVIVRPGSMLLVPAHWKVCWETYETDKPALTVWTEYNHPISKFAYKVAERKS
jgi:hypothetical protein